MTDQPHERRRKKPSHRFEGELHHFNLEAEIDRIRQEDLPEEHLGQGHRQIELQRYGGTTVTLYFFEAGGDIPEHTVEDRAVTLQVLRGCLDVETTNDLVEMSASELLTIKPGLSHSLRANEQTELLLTISR